MSLTKEAETLCSRRPRNLNQKLKKGEKYPEKYCAMFLGLSDSGKSSLACTLYDVANSKEFTFKPLIIAPHGQNTSHGTVAPTILPLTENCDIVDTKGIQVPRKMHTEGWDQRHWEKWVEKNTNILQLLYDPAYFLKMTRGQNLRPSYPFQLAVIIADATLFERSLSPESMSKEDISSISILHALVGIIKTTPSIHPVIVLTKKDLLQEDTDTEEVINEANKSGCEVFLFENYHKGVEDRDRICIASLELLGSCFDLIDAKLGAIPEKEKPLFKIDHVWYGKLEDGKTDYERGEQATQSVVVTDLLIQRWQRDGGKYLHINPHRYNNVFGDPFPGKISNRFHSPKILHIEYTIDDVEMVKNVLECEPLNLP